MDSEITAKFDALEKRLEKHIHDLSNVAAVKFDEQQMRIQQSVDKSMERLDTAAAFSIKKITEALSSFKISDYQRLTEESVGKVEEASTQTLQRFGELTRWFHWKNLTLAFLITLLTTLAIGLYLNDEMPWEAHKHAKIERRDGQMLERAWPHLSIAERQRIIKLGSSEIR